jgi:hypothetical protein
MRFIAIVLSVLLGASSSVSAQGNPSGRGAVTGDPAASSSNPSAAPPQTTGSSSSPSGSGTSTSGGKDDNMDGGRDKMPESVRTQNERSQQKKEPR